MTTESVRSGKRIAIGTLVRHANKAEWGLGKVLDVIGDNLTIYFAGIVESKSGDALKTLKASYVSVAEVESDEWLDNLPPLPKLKGKGTKNRVTLEQAKAKFRHDYALLFADPQYVKDERTYKWRHHELFEEQFGKGEGQRLLREGQDEELKTRMKRMCSINLLFPQEQIKLREAFDLSDNAVPFFRALFRLLDTAVLDRSAFDDYVDAAKDLQVVPGKRVATWPAVTVIPFLAQPSRFMFLKPEVTKEAAERLRFDLFYDSDPNWSTYERLLRMSDLLMEELRPMGARDWIDVQSFIWVVADHD